MRVTTAVIWAQRGALHHVAGLSAATRLRRTAEAAGISRCLLVGPEGLGLDESAIVAAEPAVLFLHTELALDPQYLVRFLEAASRAASDVFVAAAAGPPPPHPFAADAGADRHTIGVVVLPGRVVAALGDTIDAAAVVLRQELTAAGEAGSVTVFPPGPGYGDIVVTAADRRRAEWALIRRAAKESDGAVARVFNRRVSALVTYLLLRTPVTPNAFTFFTLVLGLLTGYVMLDGSHESFLWGAVLYEINNILDGCDGELARLRFQSTRFGAWADTLCDQVVNLVFFLAVPLALFRRSDGDPLHLWLGAFVVGSLLVLLPAVYLRSRRVADDAHFNDFGQSLRRALPDGSFAARFVAVAAAQLRRDAYGLLFVILAALGVEELILYGLVVGVLAHYVAVFMPVAKRTEEAIS